MCTRPAERMWRSLGHEDPLEDVTNTCRLGRVKTPFLRKCWAFILSSWETVYLAPNLVFFKMNYQSFMNYPDLSVCFSKIVAQICFQYSFPLPTSLSFMMFQGISFTSSPIHDLSSPSMNNQNYSETIHFIQVIPGAFQAIQCPSLSFMMIQGISFTSSPIHDLYLLSMNNQNYLETIHFMQALSGAFQVIQCSSLSLMMFQGISFTSSSIHDLSSPSLNNQNYSDTIQFIEV